MNAIDRRNPPLKANINFMSCSFSERCSIDTNPPPKRTEAISPNTIKKISISVFEQLELNGPKFSHRKYPIQSFQKY